MEKHFLIRVLDWASKKKNGFGYQELLNSIELSDWEVAVLDRYFDYAVENRQRADKPQMVQLEETIFFINQ